MAILEYLEKEFQFIVQFGVLFLEFVGVAVLLVSAVRSIVGCFRRDPHVRLVLAQGIALALEFKLGGEVLRTAIVREPQELITLGAIILLRGALTFLIHWEIKNEESKISV
ncbi:DUF1622 domain-containing protein [uncultured Dysosmobacter sp.]|uniref:DUF1622 domain-containing protein n=1 Tax=uncultured Dysosmobacter sp. TaxID=2591384 RepID=UPI00263289D4|nr:DUF1622 domain-containing protein [uncultured Dysosmobacter sp.]